MALFGTRTYVRTWVAIRTAKNIRKQSNLSPDVFMCYLWRGIKYTVSCSHNCCWCCCGCPTLYSMSYYILTAAVGMWDHGTFCEVYRKAHSRTVLWKKGRRWKIKYIYGRKRKKKHGLKRRRQSKTQNHRHTYRQSIQMHSFKQI